MRLTQSQRYGINGGHAMSEWIRKRGHTPIGQLL